VLRSSLTLDIVGAGFIGCEVAAVGRTLGLQVTVYEALEHPLQRVLGPEVGRWLGDVHRRHGVDLRTGVRELPAFEGWVLAAVGTEPRVELAAAAGIACDAGVLVDELGRTDAEDVYAAGDCARFWSPLFDARIRVEHFQTATRHGTAVGRAMAGDEQPFTEAPWFWSDQYDLNLQYVGASLPWDRTVVRGRLGEPPFTVFYLDRGRLRAAAGVNDGRTISQTRRLMEAGVDVAADALADPATDLKRLVAGS
jgi:3-phenylpropionate/trans-cinnamate dioxygenase ferredoxin reductase subunit